MLDYGCGDGTFLALASSLIAKGTGVDISHEQIDDCRVRLAEFGNLEFLMTSELKPDDYGSFDTVFCMETLEHCTATAVDIVLNDLARLVTPAGQVVISVPIETGLTFVAKNIIRRFAAARGLSDYRFYERYSVGDGMRMILATEKTSLDRPTYGEKSVPYHSHFGFNWRSMRTRVAQSFELQATTFSPLSALRGVASSQAWFICKPRRA